MRVDTRQRTDDRSPSQILLDLRLVSHDREDFAFIPQVGVATAWNRRWRGLLLEVGEGPPVFLNRRSLPRGCHQPREASFCDESSIWTSGKVQAPLPSESEGGKIPAVSPVRSATSSPLVRRAFPSERGACCQSSVQSHSTRLRFGVSMVSGPRLRKSFHLTNDDPLPYLVTCYFLKPIAGQIRHAKSISTHTAARAASARKSNHLHSGKLPAKGVVQPPLRHHWPSCRVSAYGSSVAATDDPDHFG